MLIKKFSERKNMRGVEAAPLTYIIAAIAVVIALGILVLMGGTVKKGVAGATETLNKSIVTGAQKTAQEIGEMYGEDKVSVYSIDKTTAKVTFYIFNWKNTAKFDITIDDNDNTKDISQTDLTLGGYCSSKDLDGDGESDDLECIYDSANEPLTNGMVKIIIKDSGGNTLDEANYLYK